MAAGVDVVTDERDTARCKVPGDEREEPVTRFGRDPRIQAVRDDVVKCSGVGGEVREIALRQRDVRQAEAGDHPLSDLDRLRGEIEAGERAARKRVRHGDEVGPVTARDLEHPAALDGRRRHAEQRRHRCQSLGMRVGVRVAGVMDFVVGGHGKRMASGSPAGLRLYDAEP